MDAAKVAAEAYPESKGTADLPPPGETTSHGQPMEGMQADLEAKLRASIEEEARTATAWAVDEAVAAAEEAAKRRMEELEAHAAKEEANAAAERAAERASIQAEKEAIQRRGVNRS